MNKIKRQNTRLRWRLAIINAWIVLSVFSVNGFGQNIDVKNVAAELEPEIRRAMVEGKIPSATIALVSGD